MKRWWARWAQFWARREETGAGQMSEAEGAGRISDGVDYSLPLLLPRYLRDSLQQAGKLGAWLTEAARDTFAFQFDTPNRSDAWDGAITPVAEDPLREWNWATRERVLTNTHAAYQRNPIAKRAVNYVASFVVGEGLSLTCKNKAVEAVLTAFIEDPENDVRGYERQAVIDLLVDGELVTRFFGDQGQVVIVPQRPWELEYIQTERGFFRRPLNYHFQRYLSEGDSPLGGQTTEIEDVPADEILHVAINRHGYELRGKPELYTVLPWLRAYKEWLENRARQNHWRNALLWWVKVNTTSPAVIAQVATRWRKPPTPGSVAVTSANEDISAVQNNVGAGDAAEDGRQIKLMAAVGLGLPEYFLGDGENANLASANKQELPALTTFSDYQRIMIEEYWTPVFKRVIRAACDAGALPEYVEEQDGDGDKVDGSELLEVCRAFSVTYEPLQGADTKTIVEAMSKAFADEAVSLETYRREIGVDPALEEKRVQRERQAQRDAMARGEVPTPPGMTPDGYGQGNSVTQRPRDPEAQSGEEEPDDDMMDDDEEEMQQERQA